MKHRKLRIAWSVAWGIVAVLLVVLWVRSYSRIEGLTHFNTRGESHIISSNGRMLFEDFAVIGGTQEWFYWFSGNESFADMQMQWLRNSHDFGWSKTRKWTRVMFPYWLPAIVCTTLWIAPWMRWPNRFSVRALLIATTLLAVGLGLIVWAAH